VNHLSFLCPNTIPITLPTIRNDEERRNRGREEGREGTY